MKRSALIKHLEKNDCYLLTEGSNHAIYTNPANQKQTAVGRHQELDNKLCKNICKQLEIPFLQ
jgi:predicted RNA binding protein YcfA (HicA-like mRNA interferase family)